MTSLEGWDFTVKLCPRKKSADYRRRARCCQFSLLASLKLSGIIFKLYKIVGGKMAYLILIRHGESQWNLENRFTGWVDVELSEKGKQEAEEAGRKLKDYKIDKAYTSVLKRAINTLDIAMTSAGKSGFTVVRDASLNERHYGDLQGLNKAETAKKFGDEQVHIWRRSYDIAPPNGESLKDTAARTLPYFKKQIMKDVMDGKNIIVAAHGNSLRSIVMDLDKMTKEQVLALNIPTGVPLVYEIDSKGNILSKKTL
jgi:2,3-bisphosphoglycerate-dependent phosphoglycerate mutase